MKLPLIFLVLILNFSLPQFVSSGEIKLCVKYEGSERPAYNATVSCYDEDTFFDDFLASGQTGTDGCILLNYTCSSADIYCNVYHPAGLNVRTPIKYDHNDYVVADFGTIYFQTMAPSVAPTSEEEKCVTEVDDYTNVFTDWRKVVLGLVIAAVLTIPAVSVYYRKTEQEPKKSYKYSCIVKFVGCFFSASVLVDGFLKNIQNEGCYNGFGVETLPFITAVLIESIEFTFDFSRLMLCFVDPGEIDFYQNVRWNSSFSSVNVLSCCAVGIVSIPMAIIMIGMWILVIIVNFVDGIFPTEQEDGEKEIFFKQIVAGFDNGFGAWMMYFAIFVFLTFSCTGGYHLSRMICPCTDNAGEDRGTGYYWGQFKVIAIDLPSLITTIFINPSTLVFFWTAEFVNDMFPTVAGYVIEKFFSEDEEDNDDQAKLIDRNYHDYRHALIPLQTSMKRRKLTIQIANEYPTQLEGRVDRIVWDDFCNKIQSELQYIVLLKGPKPDKCLKLTFIILGLLLSFIYWLICRSIYNFFVAGANDDDIIEPIGTLHFFVVLATFLFIGGYIGTKICFGRNIDEERRIIDNLKQICKDQSVEPSVIFSLKTQESICSWFCRGGISFEQGVDSIQGIGCSILIDDSEQENIDQSFESHPQSMPAPSAPEVSEVIVTAVLVDEDKPSAPVASSRI